MITARLPAVTRTLASLPIPFRVGCGHVTDPVELPGAHRVNGVLAWEQPPPSSIFAWVACSQARKHYSNTGESIA